MDYLFLLHGFYFCILIIIILKHRTILCVNIIKISILFRRRNVNIGKICFELITSRWIQTVFPNNIK